MKTLPGLGDVRKGSLSVPVSIGGKTRAPDHSKALMTDFRAIPHLFYCLSSDLSSPFVPSLSVERRKDSIKTVASKLIRRLRFPSRAINIVHQTQRFKVDSDLRASFSFFVDIAANVAASLRSSSQSC